MSYISTDELLLELKDQTLWITLNRPKSSNALSETMIEDLTFHLEKADEDNRVKSIVITGAGENFCAGGDIKDMQKKSGMFAGQSNELRERYKRGIQKIPLCFEKLSTPVIAMVNGAAIGAGLDLACMCDIRIGSDKSRFGETFVKIGLVPGDGGCYFLQRVIGFSKAMELSLSGEIIDATEAYRISLLNKLVDSTQLLNKTKEMVSKINANASIAVQMTKRALIHSYQNDLSSVLDLLSAYQAITQRTEDHTKLVDNIFNKSEINLSHK